MSKGLLAQAEEQFSAGRFDAVADLCGELIGADSDCHQAYYLLGRTCLALGRSDEALEMIGRAVEIKPSAALTIPSWEICSRRREISSGRQVHILKQLVSHQILLIRMSIWGRCFKSWAGSKNAPSFMKNLFNWRPTPRRCTTT